MKGLIPKTLVRQGDFNGFLPVSPFSKRKIGFSSA